MKASEIINLRSEILEPLHSVATELADLDEKGKGHNIEYTDLDVIAAAVTFLHVMAHRKAHEYLRRQQGVGIDEAKTEMESYGRRVAELVGEMTGVNLNDKK